MALLSIMYVRGWRHMLQVLVRYAGTQQEQSSWTCSVCQEALLCPLKPGLRAVPFTTSFLHCCVAAFPLCLVYPSAWHGVGIYSIPND